MNTARIVVLTIAVGAGGVAAYLASGSDSKAPSEPTVQLQTVDVLVAKNDIGLGQSVTADDVQWQIWPAARNKLRAPKRGPGGGKTPHRLDRPPPLHRGGADPRAEAGQAQRLRLH